MSNPATQVATASVIASSTQGGSLQAPVIARYPPTGAMARLTPSQRWGHQVNRFERLYKKIQLRAIGLSARQSGFNRSAEARKIPAAMITDIQACASDSRPPGSSRFKVRGFLAS